MLGDLLSIACASSEPLAIVREGGSFVVILTKHNLTWISFIVAASDFVAGSKVNEAFSNTVALLLISNSRCSPKPSNATTPVEPELPRFSHTPASRSVQRDLGPWTSDSGVSKNVKEESPGGGAPTQCGNESRLDRTDTTE